MYLVVLNVACPFAPVGPDAVAGPEQLVAHLDAALVRQGYESIVMACAGSVTAGILLATPRPSGVPTESERHKIYEQYRFTLQKFLEKWPIDLIHMHGADFYEYLPPPGIPVLVTLHSPVNQYPEAMFELEHPQMFLQCVSASQQSACSRRANMLPAIENTATPELAERINAASSWNRDVSYGTASDCLFYPQIIDRYFAVYERLVGQARAGHAAPLRTEDISSFAG